MLSAEQRIAKARALTERAAIERMMPLEFLAFAEWLGLAETADGHDAFARAEITPGPAKRS